MNLTKKDIINIIKNWDVGQLKNYTLLYSHWNLSYKITTTKGIFILKVLIMQKEETLKKELKVLSLLKGKVPIRLLIKSKSGRDYIIIKKHPVLIFEFIDGIILKDGSKASLCILKELGKYLALIHETKYGEGKTTDVLKEISGIMYKINKSSLEYMSISKCMKVIKKRGLDKQKFPKGLIHGDIHSENMIVKNDKIVALLDFEDANINYFVYDIGLVILDTCFIRNKDLSKKRINTFLEGYEGIRPLKNVEKRYIYDVILINWMRILYYSLIKGGVDKDILKTEFMKDYFKRVNSLMGIMEKGD